MNMRFSADEAIVEARVHQLMLAAGADRPYVVYVDPGPDGQVRVRLLVGRSLLMALVEPQNPVKPQLARLIERIGTAAAAP